MPKPRRSPAEMLVSLLGSREAQAGKVARLLHDEVGQVLSAVGLQLDVLRGDLKDKAPEIVARTAEIQQLLDRAIEHVREASFDLNPAIVERAGLRMALDRLAGRAREGFSGALRLFFDNKTRLPLPAAVNLYKCVECALENAVTHAGARKIEILVRPAGGAATAEVRDNGRGLPEGVSPEKSPGIGFLLIDHYARQAGLEWSVKSVAGKGTIVKILYRAAR